MKKKTTIATLENKTQTTKIDGKTVEKVDHFKYLEMIIERNRKLEKEINERIGKTGNS